MHDAVATANSRKGDASRAAVVLIGARHSRSRAFILVRAVFDYNDANPSDQDIVTALRDSTGKPTT